MSFSLGFDDLPNSSYQTGGGDYQQQQQPDVSFASGASGHHSGYGGGSGGGAVGPDDAAFSTAFSPAAGTSPSQDLKVMLESNKDGLKLEAMRRLVSLMARGKNETACRTLFPSIVKCVVTKNPELKKLVYAYLVRFADSEPDLALLSVSSFQRSLKDPNPLIRGSALRVLASIRVPVIAPLILAAIKESSNDMSPYVRKTAALSVPKLISLDPELKDDSLDLIKRLLEDKTTHVLGSVVAAFTEVCPDRLDLLHPHYRKFVALLPDFDEWGQVLAIQLLTRYARTQFTDPFRLERATQGSKDRTESVSSEDNFMSSVPCELDMDPDLKMLLKNTKPLLQSRNSSVVFSVLQLHLAIFFESSTAGDPDTINNDKRQQFLQQYLGPCVKPLVRLISSSSSHKEIQELILSSIVSLTESKDMSKIFEPFLRSFFVKSRESIHVKLLKLKVLTNLATSGNIGLILREFQAYVNTTSSSSNNSGNNQSSSGDGEESSSKFVSSVITAIGDVATEIREVAEICLKGLIALLSNRANDAIVAQAVIVIRTQIMNRELMRQDSTFQDSTESSHSDTSSASDPSGVTTLIIKQLVNSKLMSDDLDEKSVTHQLIRQSKSGPAFRCNIETAGSKARATILWILAEFCHKNFKAYQLSPDILRKFSKRFSSESNLVKLQILNLAAKMHVASSPSFDLPFLMTTPNGHEVPSSKSSCHPKTKCEIFDRNRLVLLTTYIFNLAKYDLNYDIRDRARFLKSLINHSEGPNATRVRKILFEKETISSSPVQITLSHNPKEEYMPLDETENSGGGDNGTAGVRGTETNGHDSKENEGKGRVTPAKSSRRHQVMSSSKNKFRIGTLAHFIGQKTPGYENLPEFPETQPDPSVRNVFREELLKQKKEKDAAAAASMSFRDFDSNRSAASGSSGGRRQDEQKLKAFYSETSSEDESSGGSEEGSDEDSGSGQTDASENEDPETSDQESDGSGSGSEEESEENDDEETEDESETENATPDSSGGSESKKDVLLLHLNNQ